MTRDCEMQPARTGLLATVKVRPLSNDTRFALRDLGFLKILICWKAKHFPFRGNERLTSSKGGFIDELDSSG